VSVITAARLDTYDVNVPSPDVVTVLVADAAVAAMVQRRHATSAVKLAT